MSLFKYDPRKAWDELESGGGRHELPAAEDRIDMRKVEVEIEIRGDYIVDCNGQTVDANAVGLSPSPTGNGTPGGTFLSTFRVHHPRRFEVDRSRQY